jgi:hypothetical protein
MRVRVDKSGVLPSDRYERRLLKPALPSLLQGLLFVLPNPISIFELMRVVHLVGFVLFTRLLTGEMHQKGAYRNKPIRRDSQRTITA